MRPLRNGPGCEGSLFRSKQHLSRPEIDRLSNIEPKTRWDILAVALAGMLLVYIWRVHDLFAPLRGFRLSAVATVLTPVIFILSPRKRWSARRFRNPVYVLIIAILVLMVFTVPGSLYQGLSFWFIVNDHIKTVLLVTLLAASIRAYADVERFALIHVVGATLYCAWVVMNFQLDSGGRLAGLLYYDSNDLSLLIVCVLPFIGYFLQTRSRWFGRLGMAAVALPVLLVAFVRSGSRGGFLGLGAVSAFLLLQSKALSTRMRVSGVAAIFAGLFFFGGGTYWESMESLLSPTQDYNWANESQTGRMEIWKRGIGYMADNPLLGVGVRAFSVAEGRLSPQADLLLQYGIGFKFSVAHNSFVQIGAETGVFGLAMFVALLALAFRQLHVFERAVRRTKGKRAPELPMVAMLRASLIGYIVSGFFLSQAYSAFLYAQLAMIIGLTGLPTGTQTVQHTGRRARGGTAIRAENQGLVVDGEPALAGRGTAAIAPAHSFRSNGPHAPRR